jgi:hypothetical protein
VPALLVDRNRNSTSRRDQYRKVGLQEAIPRLASIVDELRATRKLRAASFKRLYRTRAEHRLQLRALEKTRVR